MKNDGLTKCQKCNNFLSFLNNEMSLLHLRSGCSKCPVFRSGKENGIYMADVIISKIIGLDFEKKGGSTVV